MTNTAKTSLPALQHDEKFVVTRTGSTVHVGAAFGGAVQTKCGVGYGRRSYGRAVDASLVDAAHVCGRCAAMK